MSPLVMAEHFIMSGPAFAPHPHAGMSAVTLLLEDTRGVLRSRDTLRNDHELRAGDLLWTMAGRGIVHDQQPVGQARLHGVRLYVNLPQRLKAFRQLLQAYPENLGSATLIQIASPSRESVDAYASLLQELESLCGGINGNFGELDWMPVRYIHQVLTRAHLAGLCRAAAVGLVTPLRDGMNLVAKEFIAAQDPADPGVLVLSRFAGAAEQLQEALLVNPYDAHSTADSIDQALQMPLAERIQRHQKLLARIQAEDVHWWCQRFLHALDQCQPAVQRKPRFSVPALSRIPAAGADLPMTRPTRDGSFPYLHVVTGGSAAPRPAAAAQRMGR